MRQLDFDFEAALEAYTQHLVWMVDFEFSSNYYFTNAQHDIWYDSNRYLARTMEVTPGFFSLNITSNQASIIIDNVDLSFSAIMEGEEIRGKKVTIRQAALNDLGEFVAQEPIFIGILDSGRYDHRNATLDISSIMTLWQKKIPRRQASPKCQVVSFGDSYCQYANAGSSWCDRSWERCVELGNQNNFRGFRYISYLMENPDIWWGKAPSR